MNAAGPPERGSDARRHPGERHGEGFGSRLSWLRAGVLGANDGIVSVAGLVVGVAGVTTERGPLFTAGLAGLVRGRCRWPSASTCRCPASAIPGGPGSTPLAALKSIRAARPDGAPIYVIMDNLDLIVDKGRPVDALADNSGNRWGTTKNQVQHTWRSGLGVDAAGSLVYVAGANLNLVTLADALIQAGAVRGMQLDIHNEMVAFLSYPGGAAHVGNGVQLLPDMPGSLDRYLVPDQRDFFAVTQR